MSFRTTVVVPAYNEGERFSVSDFVEFLERTSGVGFVLVDDGSRDDTIDRLREVERAMPERVEVLTLSRNRGKAEAVRAGLLRAFDKDPEHVGYWDADLATPLEAILDFLRLLEERSEVEFVCGARVVMLGREVRRSPVRHYVGRVAATFIALALGMRTYDTQCGAKLFRATPLVRSLFDDPFLAGWVFDVEILARLVQACGGRGGDAARRIYEMPLDRWSDVPGSKIDLRAYLRAGRDLARIYRRYLR